MWGKGLRELTQKGLNVAKLKNICFKNSAPAWLLCHGGLSISIPSPLPPTDGPEWARALSQFQHLEASSLGAAHRVTY